MNEPIPGGTVTLTIGKAEALILFEFLADFQRQVKRRGAICLSKTTKGLVE